MNDDYDTEALYNSDHEEEDVVRAYEDAQEFMRLAHYKLAEANLARGAFEEKRGNNGGAAMFYFDAGTHYRQSNAPKEIIDVAEVAYMRVMLSMAKRYT